ncbi:MAG: hypothetical protein AAF638_11075 [Pseudomonadota bacterium]
MTHLTKLALVTAATSVLAVAPALAGGCNYFKSAEKEPMTVVEDTTKNMSVKTLASTDPAPVVKPLLDATPTESVVAAAPTIATPTVE